MSHKDVPPETESQKACREWWEKAQPTVKRAWGRAQDGSYLAEETRLIHKAWEAARQQPSAEIEELRAEVSGLRAARIAYASEFPATEDGDPDTGNIHANIRALKARAERLAEALRELVDVFSESGMYDEEVFDKARAELEQEGA